MYSTLCTAQNTNQFLLVETFPYRLENIFCRFQPFSRHGYDFFMTSLIRNIFSFLEKYAMKFWSGTKMLPNWKNQNPKKNVAIPKKNVANPK